MSGTLAQNLWAAAELLVGFGIVMLTLTLLWGLTALMARSVAWFESRATRAAALPLPAPIATATAAETGPDDEELAVVAATVALMLDRPHRVVRVRLQPSAWGQQGRSDAHSSHRMP